MSQDDRYNSIFDGRTEDALLPLAVSFAFVFQPIDLFFGQG